MRNYGFSSQLRGSCTGCRFYSSGSETDLWLFLFVGRYYIFCGPPRFRGSWLLGSGVMEGLRGDPFQDSQGNSLHGICISCGHWEVNGIPCVCVG